MTLHFFNPSHEEALASGSPLYYPSLAARRLAADLSLLPALWAAEGDVVLLEDDAPVPGGPLAERGVRFVRMGRAGADVLRGVERVEPWGWDALAARRLLKAGVPDALLPDAGRLAAFRRLSSRFTAVELLRRLRADVPETVGESFWCETLADVARLQERFGTLLCKAPWSGSGRGLFRFGGLGERERLRLSALLRRQGGVEAEPFYRRRADFAMEFRMDRCGVAHYEGFSVFETTESGGYGGSRVGSEADLRAGLAGWVEAALLDRVRDACLRHLPQLLSGIGETPLGVDMMVVETPGGLRLHPCVELNLRRTMGQVAVCLHTFRRETAAGVFRLRPVEASGLRGAPALTLTPGATTFEAVFFPERAAAGSDVVEAI